MKEPELPELVEKAIISIYRALIKRLKAEILKLRTYPIPEPWCSFLMRERLNNIIETEFIFIVCPEVDEDMKPLVVSERDILPGGISRKEYNKRLGRIKKTSVINEYEKPEFWEGKMLKWLTNINEKIKSRIDFAFQELSLLYRDGRTLEYLVNKNDDDKLLNKIWETVLRSIRHFYNNRIDIPSVAISFDNSPVCIAPPKVERNLPVASGVDRGANDGFQLVTPAAILVFNSTVIVADKCGHLVSWYRREDLESIGYFHLESAETPVSMTLHLNSLYVCYSHRLVQYNLSETSSGHIHRMNFYTSIEIPNISCVVSTATTMYVGTLVPSLIRMHTDYFLIDNEFSLTPIQYENTTRFIWLQDMKLVANRIICLFTGSPYPIQMFTLEGKLIRSVVSADQLSGAYHFNVFFNPVTATRYIYVTDFWENVVKVFDTTGNLIDTYCEKGSELCQLIHPTGIFIESSGYISVCDMKEDNCLQRL